MEYWLSIILWKHSFTNSDILQGNCWSHAVSQAWSRRQKDSNHDHSSHCRYPHLTRIIERQLASTELWSKLTIPWWPITTIPWSPLIKPDLLPNTCSYVALQACYIRKGLNLLCLNQDLSQKHFMFYVLFLSLGEKHFTDSEDKRKRWIRSIKEKTTIVS